VHVALDGRDGQTERARIGVGNRGYLIRHASATEHVPHRAGYLVQDGPVLQPAGR